MYRAEEALRARPVVTQPVGRIPKYLPLLFSLALCGGCATFADRIDSLCHSHHAPCAEADPCDPCVAGCPLPRELDMVSLPSHVVAPPDVLLIESVNSLRPPASPIVCGDGLTISIGRGEPIGPSDGPVVQRFKIVDGIYVVGTDGHVNLGPIYGSIKVQGMSISQVEMYIRNQLKKKLTNPTVAVTLAQPQAKQHISGEHLVRPDGTVSLGIYGDVYVAGLDLKQTKCRIEQHLSRHIHNPEVNVDVLAYNSKIYYVITDGGGAGEQVFRFPCVGNETVLDAIANINGLPTVASKKDIWIARPSRPEEGHDQILQVDWNAISRGGATATNYQVLPGDRIYVQADKLITFDTFVAKFTAPFERIFGFVLLGNGTVRAIQNGHRQQGSSGGGFGGF